MNVRRPCGGRSRQSRKRPYVVERYEMIGLAEHAEHRTIDRRDDVVERTRVFGVSFSHSRGWGRAVPDQGRARADAMPRAPAEGARSGTTPHHGDSATCRPCGSSASGIDRRRQPLRRRRGRLTSQPGRRRDGGARLVRMPKREVPGAMATNPIACKALPRYPRVVAHEGRSARESRWTAGQPA